MTKWDTIQSDVADMYVGIEENEAYYESLENDEDEDIFGFSKAIEIDHLTDDEVEEIFNMFGDK
jgi:hypothetical protein